MKTLCFLFPLVLLINYCIFTMFLETNCNNLKAISVLLGFHPVLMTDILYNNSNSAKYGKLRKHITIQEILLEKVTA